MLDAKQVLEKAQEVLRIEAEGILILARMIPAPAAMSSSMYMHQARRLPYHGGSILIPISL